MKLSIITPTFNSDKIIAGNVNSILGQSYNNYEHIFIDNLSSDDTISIIRNLFKKAGKTKQLKIISERDSGISDAFNKGINSSRGEIIGILNSDDKYFNNNVLERVIKAFNDEKILFVHGDVLFLDMVYGSNIRKPLLRPITYALPFNHPTMFFRKEVYNEYGIFDTDYKYAMDFEFICRLVKQIDDFYSKGIYLKGEPLITMAGGGASWTNELDSIEETRKALKKYDYWNLVARKNYTLRKLRTNIKSWLSVINMGSVVTKWRKRKWDN